MSKFEQIDGHFRIVRQHFAEGTWIDYAYPYAKPIKARVLCSNGQKKVTKVIGRPFHGSIVERRAQIQWGEGTTVSGTIAIFTSSGEFTASHDDGIVMFRANPNGVNAGRYPVGWYHQQHERTPGPDA